MTPETSHDDIPAELADLWGAVQRRPTPAADVDRMRQAVAAHVSATAHASRPAAPRSPAARARSTSSATPRRTRWLVAGAVAALVLAVVTPALYRGVARDGSAGPAAVVGNDTFRDYTTQRGERATVRLADGTMVVLNVGSRLRVPATFAATGVGSRTVHLEGEARFEVTHDPKRPFVVHAGGAVIRDLATVFGVRAYPGSTSTAVMVASGKVAVHAEVAPRPNGATVSAGEIATVDAGGQTTVRRSSHVSDLLGWTSGRLVIDGMPARDALAQLSRWYDVDFEVRDSAILRGTLTATADARPLNADDLDKLAYMFGARVERRGRLVIITPHSTR